jgi:CubicO group peptidase (beta-lactamase class C family)
LGNRKGPGRISSTAQDLLKWDVALGSGTLVSEATLSNAFMPMRLTDGSLSDYGFGWMLRADPRFGKIVYHTGSNPGYSTIIVRYLDKKKTVIMLNNNAHEEFNAILTGIESAID